jgi:4-diphosphocytidyl-2-C-methyl-D-erythritol kinase
MPPLAAARAALARTGAFLARLSGSGSALFALFDDAAGRDAAIRSLASEFPDFRFIPTATGAPIAPAR